MVLSNSHTKQNHADIQYQIIKKRDAFTTSQNQRE